MVGGGDRELDAEELEPVSKAEESEGVFLALYNLQMISRNHEEAIKREDRGRPPGRRGGN